MWLVIELPDEEYELYKQAYDRGMGSTAIRRILNGKPYEECKTGHWIELLNGNMECSECWVEHPIDTNYCPWRGAKMEGVK